MQYKNSKYLLLATACLIGFSASSAFGQSSVQLYGLIDTYVGASKSLGGSSAAVMNTGGLSTPFWGLRGSEDLGDGLKAIFAVETFFQSNNGQSGRYTGDTFFGRNAYVGLSDNAWGSVRLGRNVTPYFLSTILFNPFIDSFTFSPIVFQTYLNNGHTGSSGLSSIVGDTAWNNSVEYSPPQWNGLTASLIYAFGGDPGSLGSNKAGGNLMYSAGNFSATAAFQQVRYSGVPDDLSNIVPGYSQQSAVQAGAAYDFKVLKLYGQYQHMDNSIASSNVNSNGGEVGMSVPLGFGRVMASYAYSKLSGPSTSVARNTWAVGYDYDLSKLTNVYVAYFSDRVTGLSSADTLGVGIRTGF